MSATPSGILVRVDPQTAGQLFALIFSRYPFDEWATFARFGWRETPEGLVLTLTSLDVPGSGDLDPSARHVVFNEPYTSRMSALAKGHPLAVGVIHSHPQNYQTRPSSLDDDMDGYFAEYFGDYAPGRPYVSLIFARDAHGRLAGTGRVFWKGTWHLVTRFSILGHPIGIGRYQEASVLSEEQKKRVARLRSSFGEEAAERLARATIAVLGASGTGSPAIEAFARAGVGTLIVVDPDDFTDSNLERVHGSSEADVATEPPKVEVARRHVLSINPRCHVVAIRGRQPQRLVLDALVRADAVLCCTDTQHGRLAVSDLAIRYLVPALDCGVCLEGGDGSVTGQVCQIVRFLPSDACPYCREMVVQKRLNQELMSPEQIAQRQAAAQEAIARGEAPDPYWQNMPQLNTVGYLTTTVGAMAAGYVIGWITGRFSPPFTRLQFDLSAPCLEADDYDKPRRGTCTCTRNQGMADQAGADAFVFPPAHWAPAMHL